VREDTLSERDKKPVIRSTETRYDEPFKEEAEKYLTDMYPEDGEPEEY